MASSPTPAASTGMSNNVAGALCYLFTWVTGLIFLLIEPYKNDKTVRFHGFQGLYLFVAWLIEEQVMRPIFGRIPGMHLHALISALLLGASIFMMVKAAHDEAYSLPLFGELAQRSMTEE